MSQATPRSRVLACVAAALACCVAGPGWAQADALQHDPFARPAIKAPPPAPPRDAAGAAKTPVPEPAWNPELDAVIVAGPKSAVSIDGTIVGIGEEINGHRLVEVTEQAAVFVKNRKRVTLSLRGIQQTAPAAQAGKDERATPARPDAPVKQATPQKPDDRGPADRRDERKPEEK
jgi:hypothetical protein